MTFYLTNLNPSFETSIFFSTEAKENSASLNRHSNYIKKGGKTGFLTHLFFHRLLNNIVLKI